MNNKRRLWQIFGPVVCALVLLLVTFLLPWERTFSKKSIYEAANSQKTTIFKGSRLKEDAFKEGYVPFYGSSELSRFDPLHPSILAKKYHRNYRPFLLGGAGSQSLVHFLGMQGTASVLKNKKAVVIISPQWFTKKGQDPAAFSLYYSPLEACDFLLSAKNTRTDRYAAKRLLKMPEIKGVIKSALKNVAHGKKITGGQHFMLVSRRQILSNEDKFFSAFQLGNRTKKINRQIKLLPNNYSVASLNKVADEQATKNTSSNTLGINNSFYQTRLHKKVLAKLKGSQRNFDYTNSVEYNDFELMLTQFARQHTNVLFIIPPVNEKWAEYTGLSLPMYQDSVSKIKFQLESQGFNHISDLSQDGGDKHFMEDTIHLGWRGWVAVDQAVKPFMKTKNKRHNYNMLRYFYSKSWRKRPRVSVTDYRDKNTLPKSKDNLKRK